MNQRQRLFYFISFVCFVRSSFGVVLFATKSLENVNSSTAKITSLNDTQLELPLFQQLYFVIRLDSNDLQSTESSTKVIGFQVQLEAADPDVLEIERAIKSPAKENGSLSIMQSDLYIMSDEQALDRIFNVYPSPNLVFLDKNASKYAWFDTAWVISAGRMDLTTLRISMRIFYKNGNSALTTYTRKILVTQPKRTIDTIFFVMLPFIVIGISILMGILLDPTIIHDIIKKPKPVIIGFLAQYGLMPLLAIVLAKLFRYSPLHSLALFVIGCCPGSGASNQWTLIFDGDVNLSALMSFVSTASSFFMMPLYFYTIGRLYMDELSIYIPFLALARSLGIVVIPYSIGMVISYFKPDSRRIVGMIIKPMMIFLLLFFMTFGIVVNWYLIMTIDLKTSLTAPLLPFIGFILGGVLAAIFGLSWSHVKTIGIEAGIQNTGIAFLIITYSFPQPYATQAAIIPLVVAFLTTKPFWIIYLVRKQRMKYLKRKEAKKAQTNDVTKPAEQTEAMQQL